MKRSDTVNVETMEILNKIQSQLFVLEKKIDIIINKPAARIVEQPNPAEQPNQQHGHNRHQQNNHNNNRPQQRAQDRQYFKAVCADCAKNCEIPFRPSPDRPVYCKECYSKRRNNRLQAQSGMPGASSRHREDENRPSETGGERTFYKKIAKKRSLRTRPSGRKSPIVKKKHRK